MAQRVLDVIESLGAKSLGEVVEGQLRFPLTVRLPDQFRENMEEIGQIVIAAPNGERVPLSRLADFRMVNGPRLISREWSQRRVTIQCNVRGRDIGSFVHEAQQRIADQVQIPEGYRIDWGGQFENMQRAQKRLLIVVPLALSLIVVLLFFSFRSKFDTLVTFASVPFACIGGIAALSVREMPLSISAAVGFITLSGLSVLNSMVLVSAIRTARQAGSNLRDAIQHSGIESLRTILMTALVASVGFIPMATSSGAGAEVQRPLATVVIGGVITSTLFTLVVLPALYQRFAQLLYGRRSLVAVGRVRK